VKFREEKDPLGKIKVPQNALWGAQTQRALENFPISGQRCDFVLIRSIVLIKKAAANTNSKLGLLNKIKANNIIKSCDEILKGKYNDQFVVDVFHSGAGTSLHMNVNEVIANLSHARAHDHVNMAQSTNDVMPSALRISVLQLTPEFLKVLAEVCKTFNKKGREFSAIIKPGRTHLRDAMPVTLGQEFKAYAAALENDLYRIRNSADKLRNLGIGGTAVGTGVNSHPKYIKMLSELTGIKLQTAKNLQESMQNTSDFLEMSSSLRILAQNLIRISNDLRLLSSGPGTGLNELILPEVQPGSSIMPGKINPSIIEMLTIVCFQVIGFDQAVFLSSINGQLELNVWLPLIAHNLINQIRLLTNALKIFNQKCLKEVKPNREMINFWLQRSTGFTASLNKYIGYEKAADLLSESIKTGTTVMELAVKKGYLSKQKAKKIFDLKNLIKPNL